MLIQSNYDYISFVTSITLVNINIIMFTLSLFIIVEDMTIFYIILYDGKIRVLVGLHKRGPVSFQNFDVLSRCLSLSYVVGELVANLQNVISKLCFVHRYLSTCTRVIPRTDLVRTSHHTGTYPILNRGDEHSIFWLRTRNRPCPLTTLNRLTSSAILSV